jgi:hypothetical protein
MKHLGRHGTMNCIARWKTGYTVTLLSINNLSGYKSVTTWLHGYIVVTQQLNRPHARLFARHSSLPLSNPYVEGVLPKSRSAGQ